MNKRVLILDGSIHRDSYQPADEWSSLLGSMPADSVHLPSGKTVPDLKAYSHIIVTGSEASIVEPEPWFEVEASAVRDAFSLGKRLLGSCFGHQMLISAISGSEYVRRSPTWEIGWIELEILSPNELFAGLKSRLKMFALHFDEVINPPPPWRVLAQSARCAVQVMRYSDRPVFGIQAHPEIPPARARTLMKGLAERSPEHASIVSQVLASEPKDDGVAGEIVRRFLAL